ncbi:putative bifunctional diguanylate cyclase/phosphodiesterase [Novosphingobium cyanobacteriorum]|uniref:EAL domain-containing protein n=1 Tax=Novosphingobium cyanobacteriorum TaxID=3024215 RepID=A0ABT6CIQ1_9SPHN|nr:EAL domain-containing protein [Novosphingobium cyanobacteriorum]MDF8333394.1 EAL domain-containing protein [Novosphingobium cyanobacteriorum]
MTLLDRYRGALSAARRIASLHGLARRRHALTNDPNLLIGQYANLKRQVPLLYLLLIIIALASLYLMFDAVPMGVAIVSMLFVVVGTVRMVSWVWFLPPPEEISIADVRALLLRTTWAVVPICVSYLGYAFLLDHYGDASQRAGVAICLVLTAVGCIFCLMHLPQAARLVNLTTMAPYALYQLVTGNQTFLLVALIASIVTTLMIRVSLNAHEHFTELITSRAELALRRSDAERLAAENADLAMTDALTRLPNRRAFLACMEDWVRRSDRTGGQFVVGVLDLDRFKPVNDIYGHATGDQLLVQVGERLQSLGRDRLLIARLGGDEFGLLINGDVAAAKAVGEQVIELLHRPFDIDTHSLSLGCSIGFADFPGTGRSASTIFDRADYALYDVKADRRGDFAFFTPSLEKRLRNETELEAALLSADLPSELQVELQPIVSLGSGNACGVEALARWNSAAIGKIEPARFIETAERLNLIGSITTNLFVKSLAHLAVLPAGLDLSFNLSARDIVTPSTIDTLISELHLHQIAPQRLTFEITETALMRDFDSAITQIKRLRDLGASIALDDFGTGFSSLSYLSRLPIDKIKIDRSFVNNLDDPGVRKIVAAILGMCQTLELGCVAEGVETPEQFLMLRAMGYSLAQGYLFARPMQVEELQGWLHGPGGQYGVADSDTGLESDFSSAKMQRHHLPNAKFG